MDEDCINYQIESIFKRDFQEVLNEDFEFLLIEIDSAIKNVNGTVTRTLGHIEMPLQPNFKITHLEVHINHMYSYWIIEIPNIIKARIEYNVLSSFGSEVNSGEIFINFQGIDGNGIISFKVLEPSLVSEVFDIRFSYKCVEIHIEPNNECDFVDLGLERLVKYYWHDIDESLRRLLSTQVKEIMLSYNTYEIFFPTFSLLQQYGSTNLNKEDFMGRIKEEINNFWNVEIPLELMLDTAIRGEQISIKIPSGVLTGLMSLDDGYKVSSWLTKNNALVIICNLDFNNIQFTCEKCFISNICYKLIMQTETSVNFRLIKKGNDVNLGFDMHNYPNFDNNPNIPLNYNQLYVDLKHALDPILLNFIKKLLTEIVKKILTS